MASLFDTLNQSLWVWLATDVLLWALFVLFLVSVVIILRSPLQRAVWQRVFRQRLAVMSAVLLAVAACFALLDSIHLREPLPQTGQQTSVRYSVEVRSVLDLILADLRKSHEKTYSAPMATHLSALEPVTVLLPDGTVEVRREAPRLRVAGSSFPPGPITQEDYWRDIVFRVFVGALAGGLVFAALGLIGYGVKRLLGQRGRADRSTASIWRWVGTTLGVLFVLAGIIASLSMNFHVLGTDKVGQDVLYQVLKSLRTALIIGLVPTLVTLPIGIVLGLSAGYFRGRVDDVIQYVYTTVSAIPGVLLIAAAVLSIQVMIDNHPEWFATAVERGDIRLLALCLILGMTSWTGIARLLRGEALKMREYEYVQAARAFGVRPTQILLRHILPNVFPIILITLVMEFSSLVLAEAVLSYIGIGVDPTMFSFGLMINNARMELSREPVVWWSLTAAFVFMVMLVLAANLLADAVRDAMDPKSEHQS
jgi:peptide/nickel transport system permease protein